MPILSHRIRESLHDAVWTPLLHLIHTKLTELAAPKVSKLLVADVMPLRQVAEDCKDPNMSARLFHIYIRLMEKAATADPFV